MTLTLTPSSAGVVALSAPSVSWLAAEWDEVRSVTVTSLAGSDGPSETVELAGAVTSNAEFYSGFVLSVAVEVMAVDPAPTTSVQQGPVAPATPSTAVESPDRALATAAAPSAAPSASDSSGPTELALTGPPDAGVLSAAGLLLVAVGAALSVRRRG